MNLVVTIMLMKKVRTSAYIETSLLRKTSLPKVRKKNYPAADELVRNKFTEIKMNTLINTKI